MKALQRLSGTVPPGYDFRIGFCRVNSTDPTLIRKARRQQRPSPWSLVPAFDAVPFLAQFVLKHHWGRSKKKPRLHVEEHDAKEMFATAAKVCAALCLASPPLTWDALPSAGVPPVQPSGSDPRVPHGGVPHRGEVERLPPRAQWSLCPVRVSELSEVPPGDAFGMGLISSALAVCGPLLPSYTLGVYPSASVSHGQQAGSDLRVPNGVVSHHGEVERLPSNGQVSALSDVLAE